MCSNEFKFLKTAEGGITAFGLFVTAAIIAVGGLAIDVNNAMRARTQLQVAADSAAHAALVSREHHSTDDARALALEVASAIIPADRYGDTLTAADIKFGEFDKDTLGFKVDDTSRTAVLVNTQRLAERNNSVGTYFLKLVGFTAWDVRKQAVFETYLPTCLREGMVADGIVEQSSGNLYKEGFCVHSNTYVKLSSGNTFEQDVIVSMPDSDQIRLPNSGYDSNVGLEEAVREGAYKLRVLARVDEIMAGVQDPNSKYYRDYITTPDVITIPKNAKLDKTVWKVGRIHKATCANLNTQILVPEGTILKNGVLITNCKIKFGQGSAIENSVLASSNPDVDSFDGASDIRIGLNDGCKAGGGVQIVTKGGVKFPAQLKIYGSQIIAAGDIIFSSQAGGIEGASLVAGGMISGTSESSFGFCNGKGMENNFEAWYFRMAA